MAKGAEFERQVCKELSVWWTEGKRDDIFWRTAMSGGRATVRAKQGKKTNYQYGDVTFTDPVGKPLIEYFLFELKRGYTNTISVLDFLDKTGKDTVLLEWWKKAEGEKELAERSETMIIFKRNRRRTCVMLAVGFFGVLEEFIGQWVGKLIEVVDYDKEIKLVVVDYKEFFNWFTPKTLEVL